MSDIEKYSLSCMDTTDTVPERKNKLLRVGAVFYRPVIMSGCGRPSVEKWQLTSKDNDCLVYWNMKKPPNQMVTHFKSARVVFAQDIGDLFSVESDAWKALWNHYRKRLLAVQQELPKHHGEES